jgi:alkanesulfonate monooxygenase SsuD/methylene tetrahydromethanopterin reductase-like flavin-dependent oxidoreductase (luciferase family)
VEDYRLRPAGTFRPRPTIYLGGESEPARMLAADHADVWFINGQPLDDVGALIADVARRPAANGPLRYGLSAFVIARDTDAEAEAEHARRQAVALAGPMKTVPLQPRMTGLAVWDDERVYKLNAHQHDGTCHPYTCGTDSTHRPLVATRFGWQCADCGFTQAWADAPPAPESA